MATLISPGVNVTVSSQAATIPAGGVLTPLIVLATASEKLNNAGDPALGTYESNVVRTITSVTQSERLFGEPVFKVDLNDDPLHGDCRNEYGLYTLNNFLAVGKRAYVVRATVNLNDDRNDIDDLWERKMTHNVTSILDPHPLGIAYLVEARVLSYLENYNTGNGLASTDLAYKDAVNAEELMLIIEQVLEETMGVNVDGLTVNFDNDTFRTTRPTFVEDQSDAPLSGTYLGLEGHADASYLATTTFNNKVLTISNTAEAVMTVSGIKLVKNDNVNLHGGYDFIVRRDGGSFTDVTGTMKVVISSAEDPLNDNSQDNPYYTVKDTGFLQTTYILNDTLLIEDAVNSPETAFNSSSGGTIVATNPDLSAVMQVFPASYHAYEIMFDILDASPGQEDIIRIVGNDITSDIAVGQLIKVTNARFPSINNTTTGYVITSVVLDGLDTVISISTELNGAASPLVSDTSATLEFFETTTGWDPEDSRLFFAGLAVDYMLTDEYLDKTTLGATDSQRRAAVVKALRETISSNADIRAESYEYNIVLCPGFFETSGNLVSLSQELQEEVFVLGDVPFTKDPDQAVDWLSTSAKATSFNLAYYYPHGMGTNLDGSQVFVPSSAIALRTYAYSDDVSYLWLAPAGTTRGLVAGISSVGYLTGTLGTATTYVETALNQGQRDNMYDYFKNLNPITFFPQRGIIVWGQKTAGNASDAMDRVNVSRLVGYIRRQLRKHSMPFVFQPNDQITRDNIAAVFTAFLNDIVIKRGLYDFLVICDESNNTGDRIDRNELYVNVYIKPTKAIEFIYIPITIVATDASL